VVGGGGGPPRGLTNYLDWVHGFFIIFFVELLENNQGKERKEK